MRGPDKGPLKDFSELRGPMSGVLDSFIKDLQQLQRYKQKYGDLSESEAGDAASPTETEEVDDGSIEGSVVTPSDGGSITEQE